MHDVICLPWTTTANGGVDSFEVSDCLDRKLPILAFDTLIREMLT